MSARVAAAAVIAIGLAFAHGPSQASTIRDQKAPPNLSGSWRLDSSRNGDPQARMGNIPRPDGVPGEGRRGPGGERGRAPGEPRGERSDRPGRGMTRLPEVFVLVQTAGMIELRDSTGVAMRRIVITGQGKASPQDQEGVAQVPGAWQGRDLVVETTNPRGGSVKQTYELADNGQTLKITTHLDPAGDRPAVDVTRVYRRSGS
jgi:hypothetical protein